MKLIALVSGLFFVAGNAMAAVNNCQTAGEIKAHVETTAPEEFCFHKVENPTAGLASGKAIPGLSSNDEQFTRELQRAFGAAKSLDLKFERGRSEVWSGECIHRELDSAGNAIDLTFFGTTYLAVGRYTERGTRYLRFGISDSSDALENYDYQSLSNAFETSEGDLAVEGESRACSTNEDGGCYSSLSTTILRKGRIFGKTSLLLSSIKRMETSSNPDSELLCYFDAKI